MAELTYFKKFSTKSDYDNYIGGDPVLPNVSIVNDEDVYFKDGDAPEPTHDYSQDYLTFVMLTSGSIETFYDEIEFSVDGGENWVKEINNLGEGDNVLVRGHYVTGQSSSPFSMVGYADVQGNILSIYDADNFRTRTSLDNNEHQLSGIFFGMNIVSAENLTLPLTTLTLGCYSYMFAYCAELTTAPKLPATILASNCYSYMFASCTSLTSAPELPATTLPSGCYGTMFTDCSNLNYIKCLATDISVGDCTYQWVSGVAEEGTFVKNPNMSSWTTGGDGIPDNWTVQNNS